MPLADTKVQYVEVPPRLNAAAVQMLAKQLEAVGADTTMLVLKGADTGVFCKGMDLAAVAGLPEKEVEASAAAFCGLLAKLSALPLLTVAVAQGAVAGGGMGLVCACDYVIATPNSSFQLPEGLLGLVPGIIMPALLQKMLPSTIRNMVLTGRVVGPAEACNMGIADEVCNPGEDSNFIERRLHSLRHCRREMVADLKKLLFNQPYNNGNQQQPVALLLKHLNNPENRERIEWLLQ